MTNDDQDLRAIFRHMNADQAQAIREAYYRAVEGLQTLAATLELADLDDESDLLLGEHVIACQAIDAMKTSRLGRIL